MQHLQHIRLPDWALTTVLVIWMVVLPLAYLALGPYNRLAVTLLYIWGGGIVLFLVAYVIEQRLQRKQRRGVGSSPRLR